MHAFCTNKAVLMDMPSPFLLQCSTDLWADTNSCLQASTSSAAGTALPSSSSCARVCKAHSFRRTQPDTAATAPHNCTCNTKHQQACMHTLWGALAVTWDTWLIRLSSLQVKAATDCWLMLLG